jgi:hypothetical protein
MFNNNARNGNIIVMFISDCTWMHSLPSCW